MMPVCEIETERTPGIERVQTATGLSAFQRPDCAAAVWERPAPGFLPWIEAMDPARLPEARLTLRVENARDAVTEICDTCGTPEGAERAAFINDVVNLTRAFAGLMETEFLRLRFDIVTGNACRKFHVDAVAARLVCTYRGTATQYSVPGKVVRRVRCSPRQPVRPFSSAARSGPPCLIAASCIVRRRLKAPVRPGFCWCLTRRKGWRRPDAGKSWQNQPSPSSPDRRPDARI